jgi:AcrR family transcriptional regulator
MITNSAQKTADSQGADLYGQRIIDLARKVFEQHGFLRITMEGIAAMLRISKKTLYKYFPNKEALVRAVVEVLLSERSGRFDECTNLSVETPFVTRLLSLLEVMSEQTANSSYVFLNEIAQEMPVLWREIEEFRAMRITKFGDLLRLGVREGYVRADIDIDLVVVIFIGVIQSIITPEFLQRSRYSFAQLLDAIMTLFFEGMFTQEARKHLRVVGKVKSGLVIMPVPVDLMMLAPSLQGMYRNDDRRKTIEKPTKRKQMRKKSTNTVVARKVGKASSINRSKSRLKIA